jgi:hypothetical protein
VTMNMKCLISGSENALEGILHQTPILCHVAGPGMPNPSSGGVERVGKPMKFGPARGTSNYSAWSIVHLSHFAFLLTETKPSRVRYRL